MAELLAAADSVLAEVGYDAATMTEIAERAGASIGTLYQYFPNKTAVVLALRTQYSDEMQACMSQLDEQTAALLSVTQLAHRLIEITNQFVEEHRAYFAILDSPVKYKRNQAARNKLRERIARIFRVRKPGLTPDAAFRIANVSLQIIKSMNLLYGDADVKERAELVKEYKGALAAYLESRLG